MSCVRISSVIVALSCFYLLVAPFGVLAVSFEPGFGDDENSFLGRGLRYSFTVEPHRFRINLGERPIQAIFIGASKTARIEGQRPLETRSHYLTGDRDTWRRNVPHYGRVAVRGAYPGVDIEYYSHDRSIEFDAMVAPEADPGQIWIRFEGAVPVLQPDGRIDLSAGGGDVRLRAPDAYQMVAVRSAANGRLTVRTPGSSWAPTIERFRW